MKKILAIAIIMVMAIAAVFAAEVLVAGPSTIKLKFEITPVFLPKFGITYNSGAELTGAELTGADVAVTNDATSNGIIAGRSAMFAIIDHTKVNAAHTMTIGISLDNGKWVGADKKEYSAIRITDYSIVKTDNIKTRAVAAKTSGEANSVTMTYGKAGVDRSAKDGGKTIATFKVAWTADQSAPAQKYSSTITINATAI